jgi:S-formylglutathione hydrolase FrmB
MRDWSLIDGFVPGTAALIGAIALVFLVARTGRDWWLIKVPIAVAAGAVVAIAAAWAVNNILRLFPDALPTDVLFWTGTAFFALVLAVVRFRGNGWGPRAGGVAAALLVLVAAGSQINLYYGQFPSVGALVGSAKPVLTPFASVKGVRARTISPAERHSLQEIWGPPWNMPDHGTISVVTIPGTQSGFRARSAEIYLPPAYAADPRPLLPVLVLLPGQPGSPQDWFGVGQAATALDRFARQHDGLAPVVVSADANGSTFSNTSCADTSRGTAETYLTKDVPAWIEHNLQVDTDHSVWGVGGYSAGGTCALRLAASAPEGFPSFIDLSGQSRLTVDLLASVNLPDVAGYLAVGDRDTLYRPDQQRVKAACERAGIRVEAHELPGGHSWGVWRPALGSALSWYAHRSGLI